MNQSSQQYNIKDLNGGITKTFSVLESDGDIFLSINQPSSEGFVYFDFLQIRENGNKDCRKVIFFMMIFLIKAVYSTYLGPPHCWRPINVSFGCADLALCQSHSKLD